ncbi:MAG TPA: hypothetical protein VFF68_12335 [Anaerolineaceae bacterium]|nr:hypothetical protein [Anaerolineaceae bacterium]
MSILLWLLSLAGYILFLLYTGVILSNLNLIAGIAAIVLGLVAIGMNNRVLLMLSYGFLVLGELVLYSFVLANGLLYIWIAAVALTVFFATLSLRQD